MDLVFYVVWCKKERLINMVNQFKELNLPYKIVFFEGSTPQNSKDWLNPESEYASDFLQCCTRSHINALKHFYDNHKDKKYVCIVEDDVCFLKKGLKEKIEEAITVYEKNKEIDYLSLGYLPWTLEDSINGNILNNFKELKKDGSVYYNLENKKFSIWGAQVYMMKREIVEKAVSILYKNTSLEVTNSMKEYVKLNGVKQNRYIYLTPDALLPILFKQGLFYPLLGIEGIVESAIHSSQGAKVRNQLWQLMGLRKIYDPEDYYKHESLENFEFVN